jgi:hypothetical protein
VAEGADLHEDHEREGQPGEHAAMMNEGVEEGVAVAEQIALYISV